MTMRKWITCLMTAAVSASCIAAPKPNLTIKTLKLLVPIYRGTPGDASYLNDTGLAGVKSGVKLGREFYFRNTQCRLNLEIKYLVVNAPAPKNDGPTYDHIVADLRSRGVKDNQYDGIMSTGVGFTGNYGGFQEFGKTGAAFGIASKGQPFGWFPQNDPNTWYDVGWIFVHEFQHALDSPICSNSNHPEMLSDHPYSDSMEGYFTFGHHAGMHWDWVAHTLTTFGNYLDVRAATDSTTLVLDADKDGLPDNDSRLPMDEKRFGSDPTKSDTDGDGLDDLREFCADIYRGSDPNKSDSDGDGIADGKDVNPTVALAASVPYAAVTPVPDGKMDAVYRPFTLGSYVDNSASLAKSRMYACWNEDALCLFLKSPAPCTLEFTVDTSAENGFWEGGDTYTIRVTPDAKVVFTNLNAAGPVPGAKAAWGAEGLEVTIPALIGQGVSNEINFGGRRRLEDTTDGLVLLGNRTVSFNIALSSGSERALITPQWTMFDTVLAKSPADPASPTLRFNQRLTRDPQPVINVAGVGPVDVVTIRDAERGAVGTRVGSGPVILSRTKAGADAASGSNLLTASTGGRESAPFTLVVDNQAAPPALARSADGKTLEVTGEPGAAVHIYGCLTGSPVWPVSSVVLDAQGRGVAPAPSDGKGWLGAYGLGKNWDQPLFWRTDSEIKFDYEDRLPDPRLPADGFCARWSGFLNVPETGDYTFHLTTDDGSRLWIDGAKIVDAWGHHGVEEPKTGIATLTKGEHEIRVDYYEEYGWAAAHVEWSSPGIPRTHSLPVRLWPAAITVNSWAARQVDPAGNVSLFGFTP